MNDLITLGRVFHFEAIDNSKEVDDVFDTFLAM